MKHFFITGLPRSRTKWLSNFMTYGGAFCYHEGMEMADDYTDLLNLTGYEYVGDANTYLPLINYPEGHPIVIIKRDKKEVLRSLIKLFNQPVKMAGIVDLLDEKLCKLNGLEIDYNQINEKLPEIWEYCVPGLTFDHTRAEALKDMRIEVKNYQRYFEMLGG